MELTKLTILEAHKGLIKKEFSARDLCQAYLNKIKEKNREIFGYLSVNEEIALAQAKEVDNLITKGDKISFLAGIPVGIKDNILIEGLKCTAGSKMLENYIASYDATVIRKLKNNQVVFLGKTNLDEFAMGSSTENSAFGITKNPNDLTRVPGGSSGGSAAVVASDMAICSLGTDTGGSIRLPACFCGVVGLKPTYGAVSRYGAIAFASSLDQIGPITKTVEDSKIVFDTIKGKDEMDSTSVELPKIQNTRYKIQDTKIGVSKEYFVKGINPKVEKSIKAIIKKYEEAGAKIEEISLPNTKYALSTYYIISPSEVSSNLARYDGIRYGQSQKSESIMDTYLKNRGQGFGTEVKRRIMLGTYLLSFGYYDAYYLKAQKVRELIRDDFKEAFKKVDAIMAPVAPFLPFKIGEKSSNPLSMYLADVYTVSVNLAGLPALSLPIGSVNNLPVGLQIIGKWFEEEKVFQIAKDIEKLCIKQNR